MATKSALCLFTLALARASAFHHGSSNKHALLHARQTLTSPPVCQTEGVHMIVGSGAGAPQIEGYGLLQSAVDSIKAAIPGSTSYSIPFNKTSDPLYAAAASAEGVVLMTENIKWYADGCPDTPIVLLGYSQGGIILMNSLCGRSTSQPWGTPMDSSYSDNILMSITYGEETRQPGQTYNYGTCTTGAGILARANLAGCDAFAPSIRSYCELNDPRCCVGSPAPNNDTHYVYPGLYDSDVTSNIVAKYNEWKSAAPPVIESSSAPSPTFSPSTIVLTSTLESKILSSTVPTSTPEAPFPILEPEPETTPCTTLPTMIPWANTSTTAAEVFPTPTPEEPSTSCTTEEHPTPSTPVVHPSPSSPAVYPTPSAPVESTTPPAPPVYSTPVVEPSVPASEPPVYSTPVVEPSIPASSTPETTTSTLTKTSTLTLTSTLTKTLTRPASTESAVPVPSTPAVYSPVPSAPSSAPSVVPSPSAPAPPESSAPVYVPTSVAPVPSSPSAPSVSAPPYQTSLSAYNPNAASRTQGYMAWSMVSVVVFAHFLKFVF